MQNDLKLIKKYYGEAMMHYARDNFATILEEPGVLISLFEKAFAHNKYLMNALEKDDSVYSFKCLIYVLYHHKTNSLVKIDKSPFELMDEAGYILYECKKESDIQKFKKYYKPKEELCTFRGGRLENCYVFFAVKKDVDKIKRENFINPKREDEYGTSVISIQFSKINNYVSIKNRYNHTVLNPDATFGNNLENIIPGLTNAFEKYYGLNIFKSNNDFGCFFPSFVLGSDNKYYRYNYEVDNATYCANNYIIDNGKIVDDYIDKSRYLIIDYFIIDIQNKRTFIYQNGEDDSFLSLIKTFNKIEITNDKKKGLKKVDIYTNNDHISMHVNDEFNNIVDLICYKQKNIGDNFLTWIHDIEEVSMPCAENIGDFCLYYAEKMKEINLPKVQTIGQYFIRSMVDINEISFPELIEIDDCFLDGENHIVKANLPKVKKVGDHFMSRNFDLRDLNMPMLEEAGHMFLEDNDSLDKIIFLNLKIVGDKFLASNYVANEVCIPNLERAGSKFLASIQIKNIDFPNLEEVGSFFFQKATMINKINLPKLKRICSYFLENVVRINQEKLSFPSVEIINKYFLYHLIDGVTSLDIPNVNFIGDEVLVLNKSIEEANLPKIVDIGSNFMHTNEIAHKFLDNNQKVLKK